MISGASGSAGSIHNAVRGLAEFLVIVMNDEANLDGLNESPLDGTGNSFQNGSQSSQLVLEVFRSFPLNSQIQGTNLSKKNYKACEFPIKLEAPKNSRQSTGSLHVNRTKEWIVATSLRVDKLLSPTFPNVLFVNLLYYFFHFFYIDPVFYIYFSPFIF